MLMLVEEEATKYATDLWFDFGFLHDWNTWA